MAKRLKGMGQAKYQRDGDPRTSGPGFGLTVHPDTLDLPLRWRKPRRVFVNSMSDLFHDQVPDEFIARVWAVMAATPRHRYQILTKRHGRMRSLLNDDKFRQAVQRRIPGVGDDPYINKHYKEWPLPNVHLGVSVEDQKRAELRIPALLDTPAIVRFLSCEPLIGGLDLSPWLTTPLSCGCGGEPGGAAFGCSAGCMQPEPSGLDWCIIGGESGAGARPCEPEWIRALVGQCRAAGVPVFVKQLGSHWAQANGWGGKGGLPEQWPANLRVREFPG